jgi:hypothetical protein
MVLWVLSLGGVLGLVGLMTVAQMNRSLQAELARQEEILSKGQMNTQVGNSLLRDMAMAASRNAAMRDLLTRCGYPPPPAAASTDPDSESAPMRKGTSK